jgi:hypothetical protein
MLASFGGVGDSFARPSTGCAKKYTTKFAKDYAEAGNNRKNNILCC